MTLYFFTCKSPKISQRYPKAVSWRPVYSPVRKSIPEDERVLDQEPVMFRILDPAAETATSVHAIEHQRWTLQKGTNPFWPLRLKYAFRYKQSNKLSSPDSYVIHEKILSRVWTLGHWTQLFSPINSNEYLYNDDTWLSRVTYSHLSNTRYSLSNTISHIIYYFAHIIHK